MRFRASVGVAERRRGSSRFRRRALAAVVALVVVFVLVTARLIVWPAEGMPARADAIVMMAGPGDRLAVALRLAREHRAPVLVVSQGQHGYGGPCPAPVPGVKLICFDPDPGNTRGEAEFAGRLAKRYGWHSVVLVTTSTQDTRARIVMRRCFSGSIYVITAPQPWYDLPYQIAYGWGALFKALVLYRACLRQQLGRFNQRRREPVPGRHNSDRKRPRDIQFRVIERDLHILGGLVRPVDHV
jgi:uncharacterized SAM-binding protein YcdF (DUF218 family)